MDRRVIVHYQLPPTQLSLACWSLSSSCSFQGSTSFEVQRDRPRRNHCNEYYRFQDFYGGLPPPFRFPPSSFFLVFFFFFYLELLFMNRLHASSFSYSIFYHISFILTCYRDPHPPPFAVVLSQLWAVWTIFLDLFSTLFFLITTSPTTTTYTHTHSHYS